MTTIHASGSTQRIGVLASAATGLVDFIQSSGGDADRILGRIGMNPECLNRPTMALDLGEYCAVFEEAAKQIGNDNFGLRYGRQFKPDALGFLGYVGMSSATLGDALRNVARAFPWHQQGSLLQLRVTEESCSLEYQVLHGSIMHKRQDAELSLGMFANLMRHSLGLRWAPDSVLFQHAQPEAWYEHCKAFDAPVYFNQPTNALVFKPALLSQQMPARDARLLALMLDNMSTLTTATSLSLDPGQEVLDGVRTQIRQELGLGEPTLEHVAHVMRLPSWTLQRRLSDAGLNFSTLVEQTRRELAQHYLGQSGLPLSEVALQLGYSELSAFSRAFRRWHGVSPRQWRQGHATRLRTVD